MVHKMINETFFNEIYANDYSNESNFEDRVLKATNELKSFTFQNKDRALDLGAGPGAFSFALSNLGFNEITALDYSSKLLELLNQRKTPNQNIVTINADLSNLSELNLQKFDFINITGDTILYLEKKSLIATLLKDIKSLMKSHCLLNIQFRDFTKTEKILDRYKVTHQSDNYSKIISINYEGDYIYTIDLVHRKENEKWIFEKGMNKKLRVSKKEIVDILQAQGFKVVMQNETKGNINLVCELLN